MMQQVFLMSTKRAFSFVLQLTLVFFVLIFILLPRPGLCAELTNILALLAYRLRFVVESYF